MKETIANSTLNAVLLRNTAMKTGSANRFNLCYPVHCVTSVLSIPHSLVTGSSIAIFSYYILLSLKSTNTIFFLFTLQKDDDGGIKNCPVDRKPVHVDNPFNVVNVLNYFWFKCLTKLSDFHNIYKRKAETAIPMSLCKSKNRFFLFGIYLLKLWSHHSSTQIHCLYLHQHVFCIPFPLCSC